MSAPSAGEDDAALLSPFRDDVVAEPLSRERYAADAMLVASAALRAGASRVFEIGSLAAPGNSDIDLLVCFPDDWRWERLPGELLQLLDALPGTFLHPPWVMRERHVPALPALFAFRRLTDVVTGDEVLPKQSPAQRLSWNIDACCAVLAALAVRRRAISARSALCLLNGIGYNVELAAEDGVAAAHGTRFTTAIRALRDAWFTLPRGTRLQQLAVLWQLGSVVLRELVGGYATLLAERFALPSGGRGELRATGSSVVYVFDDAPGAGGSAARAWWRPQLVPRVHLPERLGAMFRLLAEGGLDRWLQWRSRESRSGAAAAALATAASDLDAAALELRAEARATARANARYLDDVLSCAGPFLPLAGGVLAHVRRKHGWAARAGRAGSRVGSRVGAGARRIVRRENALG